MTPGPGRPRLDFTLSSFEEATTRTHLVEHHQMPEAPEDDLRRMMLVVQHLGSWIGHMRYFHQELPKIAAYVLAYMTPEEALNEARQIEYRFADLVLNTALEKHRSLHGAAMYSLYTAFLMHPEFRAEWYADAEDSGRRHWTNGFERLITSHAVADGKTRWLPRTWQRPFDPRTVTSFEAARREGVRAFLDRYVTPLASARLEGRPLVSGALRLRVVRDLAEAASHLAGHPAAYLDLRPGLPDCAAHLLAARVDGETVAYLGLDPLLVTQFRILVAPEAFAGVARSVAGALAPARRGLKTLRELV